MPSFILRKLDPAFWAQVQAKASAENVRIKELILRLLTAWLASVLILSLGACASKLPNQPDVVTPTAQTAPASIRLTVSTRADRTYDVTATVLTADGHFVKDVALVFAMELGSITPEHAITNSNGVAQAVAASSSSTTLTVSAGTLQASTHVDGVPSTLALYGLSLTAGDTASFTVTGFVSGTSPTVGTSWTFGDGATAISGTASTSHRYTRAGSFTATVQATDAQGHSASTSALVSVGAAPAPPPPPPPAPPAPTPQLSATLTCTAVTHGADSACNVTVSYREPLPSGAVTRVDWDWGDKATETTTGPVQAHTYTLPGTYTVFAKVTANTGTDGSKQATTSKVIVIP